MRRKKAPILREIITKAFFAIIIILGIYTVGQIITFWIFTGEYEKDLLKDRYREIVSLSNDISMEISEEGFKEYLKTLTKPVVLCGDLNVAHQEIDIKNPKANERNAGFTIEERTAFSTLLAEGYLDTFRHLHPDLVKYSWWSYRMNARAKGIGWRIDYFLVSNSLASQVAVADIYTDIFGSDHAPILLEIAL